MLKVTYSTDYNGLTEDVGLTVAILKLPRFITNDWLLNINPYGMFINRFSSAHHGTSR